MAEAIDLKGEDKMAKNKQKRDVLVLNLQIDQKKLRTIQNATTRLRGITKSLKLNLDGLIKIFNGSF